MIKKFMLSLVLSLALVTMVGCGKDKETKIVYEIKGEDLEKLENGTSIEELDISSNKNEKVETEEYINPISLVEYEKLSNDIDMKEMEKFALDYLVKCLYNGDIESVKESRGYKSLEVISLGHVWQKWEDSEHDFYHNRITFLVAEKVFTVYPMPQYLLYPVYAQDITCNEDGTYNINFDVHHEIYKNEKRYYGVGAYYFSQKSEGDEEKSLVELFNDAYGAEEISNMFIAEWEDGLITPVFGKESNVSFYSNEEILKNLVNGKAINEYIVSSDDFKEIIEKGMEKRYKDNLNNIERYVFANDENSGKFQ